MVFTVVSFVICPLNKDAHRDLNLRAVVSHHLRTKILLCQPLPVQVSLYVAYIYIFIYIKKIEHHIFIQK